MRLCVYAFLSRRPQNLVCESVKLIRLEPYTSWAFGLMKRLKAAPSKPTPIEGPVLEAPIVKPAPIKGEASEAVISKPKVKAVAAK